MSNFSHLYSYLDDLSGPEYDYLGHFNQMEYLECGHNILGMEQQIDEGNIPDLQAAGKNTPAESEPGNISQADKAGAEEGQGHAPAMGSPKGGGSPILGSIAKPAIAKGITSLFG